MTPLEPDADILQICLQQLEEGLPLEEVLSRYPDRAAELRSLLEAALQARALRFDQPIPQAAQSLSRSRFLTEAARYRQSAQVARHRKGFLSLRWGYALALVLAFVAISLIGTGFVSAQALPGDGLYPLKLAVEQARIRLATDSSSRLNLEETFDERRVNEVVQLLERKRIHEVAFAGFLAQNGPTGWQVAGIPVTSAISEASATFSSLEGMYVEVQGITSADSLVKVSSVRLRLFHLAGRIEALQPDLWKVGGVTVEIDAATAIRGQPAPGENAEITAIRARGDRLLALLVVVGKGPGAIDPLLISPLPPQSSITPSVTASLLPAATVMPEVTPTPLATLRPTQALETRTEQPKAQPTADDSADDPSDDHNDNNDDDSNNENHSEGSGGHDDGSDNN